MTTGCNASLGLAGAVHDCDWTEPHPGHAHHNHQAGATWTGATWHDLAALRAEVEKLRDEADVVADRAVISGAGWARQWTARSSALTDVLDLIDKHAREGQ